MKKFYSLGLLCSFLFFLVEKSFSQLLVDDFNYSGNLSANGWTPHSATGTTPIATTTGLTYTGYPGDNIGNANLVKNAGGEDVNRKFATQNTIGQSIYFSFLVNVNDASTSKSGDYFIHIGNNSSPDGTSFTNFSSRVFARIVSGNVNFGLSNLSTPVTYGTTNFAKNTTYLLVVKYTIAEGNDPTSLFVFSSGIPASEAAAGTPEVVVTATAGQDIINAIALRQGTTNQPQAVVDGLRVGLGFTQVTSISKTTDQYRSITSGPWSSPFTWESSSDNFATVTSPATLTPDASSNTITIRNNHTVTVTSTVSTDQTFVNPTGALAISTGANLIVLNNGLTLQSTAEGTARIANSDGGLITGAVTVERYIPSKGRRYRLLTSATTGTQTIRQAWQENGAVVSNLGTWITSNVANAVSKGFDAQSANPSILVWDSTENSTNSWYDRLVDSTSVKPLSSEPGYLLFIRGDRTATGANNLSQGTTLRSTGNLRMGLQTIYVTGGNDYTLVGNPFASPIDFDKVLINSINIKSLFWIWDANRSGLGGYTLVRKVGDTYYAIPAPFGATPEDSTTTTLQHIQSGQAFFVEPATAEGGQLKIDESSKSAITHNLLFKTAKGAGQTLSINLNQQNSNNNTELTDGVMIAFSSDYTARIDGNDFEKINNFNENLSITRDTKNLIVESRPTVASQDTIFLNLTGTTQRNYQFAFKAENLNPSEVLAYLEDKYLKTVTAINLADITTVNFSVMADAASADANRFYVVFKTNAALPINFTTIKGARKDQSVKVEWSVATETNIASYDVEKSTNGREFAKAASVKATGSANYNWLDLTAGNGENYYRIKGISNSGVAIYSAIVKVNSITGKAGIVAYPNPLIGRTLSLQLTNEVAGRYNISLFNNIGQQVFSKSIKHNGGSSTQTIQLGQGITKGAYELKITNGENVTTQKIICN